MILLSDMFVIAGLGVSALLLVMIGMLFFPVRITADSPQPTHE